MHAYINPFDYFFPLLLVDPFCGVSVALDETVCSEAAGADTGLGAGLAALCGGEGLCKKLMKKVAKPPLIMYMSHFGTRTRAP